MNYTPPVYAFDAAEAWPELPRAVQRTNRTERAVVGMTMATAYVLSGHAFVGMQADISAEQFHAELQEFCLNYNLDLDRVIRWADSTLIPPHDTLDDAELAAVPTSQPVLKFNAKPFQVEVAAWCAHRMGSVLALSCGAGKTFTAYAAAVAARRLGKCSDERCYIVGPLNAHPAWLPYVELLKQHYKDVAILSVDSMHHYKNINRRLGGALIVDEAHKVKEQESGRTQDTFSARLGFEWCTALTGTLLHAGPGGVIAVQDLACPGLSRFCDFWKFGEVFNCIIEKQAGPRVRRTVGIPTGENFDAFVRYLNRGIRSLSFASQSLREAIQLPGQTRTLVDTWSKPAWVEQLQREAYTDAMMEFEAWSCSPQCPVIWLPDVDAPYGLAALALAIKSEMENAQAKEPAEDEADYVAALAEPADTEVSPVADVMPAFARVLMEACREGRYDRCIVRTSDTIPARYEFRYADGSSAAAPAPGVKIKEVERWIDEHPGEPAVLGAVSTGSKEMLVRMLTAKGLKFNVVDGTVTKDRAARIDAFQAGEVDYMVVQQQAGCESMTLTRAAVSFLVDASWSAITYSQYLARVHRTGQNRECEHYDLAFGELQARIIQRLARGENFDARVRAALENDYNKILGGV